MNEREIRRLTPKEYFWYFKDKLDSLVRKTFSKKEILVFVSYQPDTLTLDYNQVQADTSLLFNKYKYVEVLEKTFKTSRRYNDGDYIGGYHSHLIMKESDYKAIENQLSDMDIVAKLVYNLEGLVKYLTKQANVHHGRVLPQKNLPVKSKRTNKTHNARDTYNRLLPKEYIPVDLKEPLIKRITKRISNTITKLGGYVLKPLIRISKTVKKFMGISNTGRAG